MTLPLLLSVPHAGLEVPDYVAPLCQLTRDQLVANGDEGADQIYDLRDQVEAFVTTPIARAVLDMNRSSADRRKDGVVKTHTIWDEPIWSEPLSPDLVERLLQEHDRYHERLTELANRTVLAVDCHTMVAVGPPVSPDPGKTRPLVCLGDGDGACPREWVESLQECFVRYFPGEVTVNEPFAGGYITRTHGTEMPWVQLELSRSPKMSNEAKRTAVLAALTDWCAAHSPSHRDAGRQPR